MKKAKPKWTPTEKRPRQYAWEIMDLPREQRKEAFSKVPENLKDLVMKHCQRIDDTRSGKIKLGDGVNYEG